MSNNIYNNTTTSLAVADVQAPTKTPELPQVLAQKQDGSRTVVMGKNTDPRTLFHTLYGDNARVAGGDAHLMAYLQTHGGYPQAGDVFTVPPTEQYIGKQNHAVTQLAARIISHLNEQNDAPNHAGESPSNRKWDKADEATARRALDAVSGRGSASIKPAPQRMGHEDTVVAMSPIAARSAAPMTTHGALAAPQSQTRSSALRGPSAQAVSLAQMSSRMQDFKVAAPTRLL